MNDRVIIEKHDYYDITCVIIINTNARYLIFSICQKR